MKSGPPDDLIELFGSLSIVMEVGAEIQKLGAKRYPIKVRSKYNTVKGFIMIRMFDKQTDGDGRNNSLYSQAPAGHKIYIYINQTRNT